MRFASTICVFGVASVVGFDIDAHDAIGQTAASAMDQPAIKQLKRLLDGKDASDVAGWGHQVDDTWPGMERLHFQTHPADMEFCKEGAPLPTNCDGNICLMNAIQHFYGKILTREGRKTNSPAIDYDAVAKGLKFADVDSLKMLINLVGDLHQPLHLGYATNDMGRSIKLKYGGNEKSLYEFWDATIGNTIRDQESNFWLGGWTHVRDIQNEFNKDKDLWKEQGAAKAFESWAKETVKFACDTVYKLPVSGTKLAGPDAGSGPFEVSSADFQAWRKAWLRQILLAGERTAIVLNDILDASTAAKLKEGASVKTNADKQQEEEQKQWEKERAEQRKLEPRRTESSGPRIHVGNALTNLGIAAMVVPIFLAVVNFGPNPASWKAIMLGLMDSADSVKSGGGGGRVAKRFN
jgi:Cu/Ag efflux protein CusF